VGVHFIAGGRLLRIPCRDVGRQAAGPSILSSQRSANLKENFYAVSSVVARWRAYSNHHSYCTIRALATQTNPDQRSVRNISLKECHLRIAIAVIVSALAGSCFATLPPATDEAKAKAAEVTAKSAWTDKVGAYQLCVATDVVANQYRKALKADGKDAPTPVATPACANPGPYVSQLTPAVSKPLEASGAHSPPGTAVSPPSTKATAAEISKGGKP